jgi:hypothetical protein
LRDIGRKRTKVTRRRMKDARGGMSTLNEQSAAMRNLLRKKEMKRR